MRDQIIINRTWAAARAFGLAPQLRQVLCAPRIAHEGRVLDAFGLCDKTGLIYIRTHSLHPRPRPLSRATIDDTIAHELGHLFEFSHGKPHKRLTMGIKVWLDFNPEA